MRSSDAPAALSLALSLVILAGCVDSTGPDGPLDVRVLPEWVTGEAGAALDSTTGQFRLPLPTRVTVTLSFAESVAVAAARLYGDPFSLGNAREVLERDRGGPIDFANLRPCRRATYVIGPVGEVPSVVPRWVRRVYGSHWAVPLCGRDGAAHLSIGVADDVLDVHVADGHIVPPYAGSTDFNAVGVPYRHPSGLPVTPEAAVALVFRETGQRVTRVPVAFNQWRNGLGEFPLCASWRVEVEEPSSVRALETGDLYEAREFFVRRAPQCFSETMALFVAVPSQPQSFWLSYPRDGDDTVPYDSVEVPLTGPTLFSQVRVERE